MKRAITLLILLLSLCALAPQDAQASSKVKIKWDGKTKSFGSKKTSVYINKKKVSVSKVPVFKKTGAYVGPLDKIYKNSSLKVKKSSSGKKLTLTYNGHVLVLTHGKRKATLDGKATDNLGASPVNAKYVSSGKSGWILPLKSVCRRLGIGYILSGGKIKITGTPNTNVTSVKKDEKEEDGKMTIVLDPGHGGSDSGATGNGLREKDLTLAIVKAAKAYFDKDKRFSVHYTRTGDTFPSLSDRYNLANKVNADLFISVHINSAGSSATGTETWYSGKRNSVTAKNGITSKELAEAMQKAAQAATGFKDRKTVNDYRGLAVLNHTKMPACLIEYGFISNPAEAKKMNTMKAVYGRELYNAIVSFAKAKGKIK